MLGALCADPCSKDASAGRHFLSTHEPARRRTPPTIGKKGPTLRLRLADRTARSILIRLSMPAAYLGVATLLQGICLMKKTRIFIATAAALAAFGAHAQAKLAPNPMLPTYGTEVQVELSDSSLTTLIPATRYVIAGSNIVIDYEYAAVEFGPFPADFGQTPLELGELPPGNYTMTARMHNLSQPNSTPTVLTSNLAVMPPDQWGIYTVPVAPQARSATSVTLRSAAYFDPASMKASVSGNVVRVDFVYSNTAPASGATPEGMQTYGSVRIPDLAPGTYTIEGWGSASGAAPEKYFTRTVTVAATTPVVEYYSPSLDHYFMALGSDEIALLDQGRQGDWKRTGYKFKAWAKASDAPAGAVPVCRFYAAGPNSHFWTANAGECDYLKQLEAQGRAQAQASGTKFLGWGYEGIAFYSFMPANGSCAGGMTQVYRAYNNRAAQNDSNRRFTTDLTQKAAMGGGSAGWVDEGAQMCAPL